MGLSPWASATYGIVKRLLFRGMHPVVVAISHIDEVNSPRVSVLIEYWNCGAFEGELARFQNLNAVGLCILLDLRDFTDKQHENPRHPSSGRVIITGKGQLRRFLNILHV